MWWYRLLTTALWPLLFLYSLRLAWRYKSLKYFKQRLGFAYPKIDKDSIWIHCASVGEINTALPLIKRLQQQLKNKHFLITTNTVTGEQTFLKQTPENSLHAFLPIDCYGSSKRFIQKTQPSLALITETELWPNLYQHCDRQRIPLCIINGRLSHKTLKANKWIRGLYKQALEHCQHILSRSPKDTQAFISLGAEPDKITTLGNLKFSFDTEQKIPNVEIELEQYVLLASSHENEEEQLARLWLDNHFKAPLVIVPRHPERGEKIQQTLNKLGCHTARRSINQPVNQQTQIYIADTLGELTGFMQQADIVIMGGSFIPHGGQNLLEAARLGKAIITGPHMFNFADEMELFLQHNACIQASSMDDLKTKLQALWIDSNIKTELQHSARSLMEQCRNIPDLYASELSRLFPDILK